MVSMSLRAWREAGFFDEAVSWPEFCGLVKANLEPAAWSWGPIKEPEYATHELDNLLEVAQILKS